MNYDEMISMFNSILGGFKPIFICSLALGVMVMFFKIFFRMYDFGGFYAPTDKEISTYSDDSENIRTCYACFNQIESDICPVCGFNNEMYQRYYAKNKK